LAALSKGVTLLKNNVRINTAPIRCNIYFNYYLLFKIVSRHRRLQNFFDNKPNIGEKTFIAPNASVIGSVEVGEKTSVWYGAILRGK